MGTCIVIEAEYKMTNGRESKPKGIGSTSYLLKRYLQA